MKRPTLLAMGFAFSFAILGCSETAPKLIPVSGSIALTNGKIVKHGYVNFHPDPKKGNTSKDIGIGYIKDGVYTIKTGDKFGVVAGWYLLTVDAANETDPNNPYVTEWFAEERYTDKVRSKLTVEVKENAPPEHYELKLKPHPKTKPKK